MVPIHFEGCTIEKILGSTPTPIPHSASAAIAQHIILGAGNNPRPHRGLKYIQRKVPQCLVSMTESLEKGVRLKQLQNGQNERFLCLSGTPKKSHPQQKKKKKKKKKIARGVSTQTTKTLSCISSRVKTMTPKLARAEGTATTFSTTCKQIDLIL